MGSPTSLVLECRPSSSTTTAVNSVGCRNLSNSGTDEQTCQIQRLEEYLNALEEERKKIEAFKRELPFCMQLLHDTIQVYKEKLAFFKPSSQAWSHIQQKSNSDDADSKPDRRIIIEEFLLPVNRTSDDGPDGPSYTGKTREDVLQHRPNWMKEAGFLDMQMESNDQQTCPSDPAMTVTGFPCLQEQAFSNVPKPIFHSKSRSGGAFTPFHRDKQTVIQPTARPGALDPALLAFTPKDSDSNPPLSLSENPLPSTIKQKENVPRQPKDVDVKVMSMDKSNGSNNGTPSRKARRCWSPELHRRFVNALNQLGGPLVATPKQIRELMKVEGLTNDEVKSHLQKYRLHTRRPGASPSISSQTPQVVVLGSIWVPPEQTPALYTGLQNRPQPLLYHSMPTEEMCSQLESPEQINMHFSSASAYSQTSLQGPGEHNGQLPPLIYSHSDDAGREESVGDDRVSANSSSKAYKDHSHNHHHHPRRQDETVDKSPDGSMNVHESQCTSENDTEIDDDRDCETSLELS